MTNKKYVLGVFDDEEVLLHAIPNVRAAGTKIHEVFTPFPIHGIDDALGIERSRLPIAAFFLGCCGLAFALWLQIYTLGADWPMIIGGKPHIALPAFIPVSFELTVFFTAHHDAHGAAEAGHHATTWYERLMANLWVNNVYFTGIAVVGLFFTTVQYVAYAGWSVLIKRVLEVLAYYLPVGGVIMALVFLLPIIFTGHNPIFHWTDHTLFEVGHENYDPIIAGKSGFLNLPFYTIRLLAYFALWIGFAWWLRKQSVAEDLNGGLRYYDRSIRISAMFLVVFGVTSSLSAWDWVLSIDTHWFSTMFAWYVFASWFISGLAATTLTVILLKQAGYMKMVNANHLHDLGKFVFGFSIFWTYVWFSQFMLIWYANIPEESVYFIERLSGYNDHYTWIFFTNLVLNFAMPFLILMTRDAKRQMIMLKIVCIVILLGHWLDFYLMIMPGTLRGDSGFGLIELGTALTFLGLFLVRFTKGLTSASLVPVNHPFLEESIHHHV